MSEFCYHNPRWDKSEKMLLVSLWDTTREDTCPDCGANVVVNR